MTIYLVIDLCGDCGGGEVLAAFASKKAAQRFAARRKAAVREIHVRP